MSFPTSNEAAMMCLAQDILCDSVCTHNISDTCRSLVTYEYEPMSEPGPVVRTPQVPTFFAKPSVLQLDVLVLYSCFHVDDVDNNA
jgi:hypothetical protein